MLDLFFLFLLLFCLACVGFWVIQIWYEYVSFAKSVAGDTASKNGSAGGEGSSGQSKSQFMVLCDCGAALELRHAKTTVICSDCKEKTIDGTSFLYECPKGENSNLHRNGFKICYECGEKRWNKLQETRKQEEQEKQENESKEDGSGDDANSESGGTLFSNLYRMADGRLVEQKQFLKSKIDPITAEASWKEMIKFGEDKNGATGKKDEELLRQDDARHLRFPNRLGFDVGKIKELKLKDFYDSKVYLSNLMVVANALDNAFHDTVKHIILRNDFKVDYKRGPIKTMKRCQAKAESDYASRKYPTSSCVLG